MWAFILFCISLIITIFVYIKRNKIYDENENLNNAQITEYDKLDKIFVIMLLITIGLVGVAAYVLGWFDFDIYEEFYSNFFLVLFISFNTYAIQIVGSKKLCQDLIILMGNNDDELEILYNDLISGQLVEEDRFHKMKDLENYVLKISTLYHNLCTKH